MKKQLLFLIIIFCSNSIFSQNKIENYEIGYYFDINNYLIDGYFDKDYKPKNAINIRYKIGKDYTPGYYYDLENKKISGLIKYSQASNYFRFKLNDSAEAILITPSKCLSYVLGLDSFTVIQNFNVERALISSYQKGKEFVEVIEHFDGLTFYKHTKVGYNNIISTYLYKSDSSNQILSFSNNSTKFKPLALTVFGEIENLKFKIKKGIYLQDDIPTLVKLLKYKHKADKNEKIYYNNSWDEIDEPTKSTYYANVELIQDSIFHLKYFFNNNIPIYEGKYKSFFPDKKEGDFIWYYPNGNIRKKVNYIKDKQNEIYTYNQDSSKHYEFRKINEKLVIDKVFSKNSKIDSLGNGIEQFYDPISDKTINYFFKNKKIYKAFYLDSIGKKIYQKCETNANFINLASFNKKIELKVNYPENSIKKFNHGITYVKFIIDSNGEILDYKIIKNIDSDCDKVVNDIMTNLKSKNILYPAEVGNEKVTQEIIIPFVFSLEGFSRYRNYNNYNSIFMNQMMLQQHQQMMMNQQMMRSMQMNHF